MTQTLQIEATVAEAKNYQFHEMTLFLSSEDGSTYWLPQPRYASDRPLMTAQEFIEGNGSLEGLEDDDTLTVAVEVAGEAAAPAAPAPTE